MAVERDAIVLRRPKKSMRFGWAEAAKKLSATGDDALVWPEFRNNELLVCFLRYLVFKNSLP
jgi:antitoxin MazE